MAKFDMKLKTVKQQSIFIRFFLSVALFFFSVIQSASGALIRDTEIEDGLQALAQPFATSAGISNLTIRLVPNESYNAFIVGGRTVFVHTGLLMKAKSTSEILGVLAHEIGHLAAGHAPRRALAANDANLTTTLATIAAAALAASGASGDAALGVAIGGHDRANRNYLASSRYDESVADEWALKLLEEQDISASGMADFMRRIAAQSALPENRQSDYYHSHPGAASRLLTFEDHIRAHGSDSPGLSAEEDQLMQQIIAKVKAYSDPPSFTIQDSEKDNDEQAWPQFSKATQIYRQAIAHFRRGDLGRAIDAISLLREAHPENPYFHEFAGDVYFVNQQADEAIKAYELALTYRASPLIKFSLGRAYMTAADQGQDHYYEKAIEALEWAVKREVRWPELRRQLAIALGRNGQLAEADVTLAEEAIIIGDTQRAIQMARRALTREPLAKDTQNRANDIIFSLGGNKQ